MLDRSRTLFAFARFHRVYSEKYLRDQEAHGNRSSPTAAIRPGATPGASLFWSKFGSEPCCYVNDFRSHLKQVGARVRGGAAISAHMLIGVSSEWIQETGGIHDCANTRVRRLFEEVKAFAETAFGGVYAMRLDLDERGGGVVDVFAAPTHMRSGRPKKDGTHGKDVHEVSVKTALIGLQKKAGGGKQFSALQTLWAHHAATSLDNRIVRGVDKKISGRMHLDVFEYRQSVETEKAWIVERDGQRSTILNTLNFIAERDDAALVREDGLDQKQRVLDESAALLNQRTKAHLMRVKAVAARERELDVREQSLERTREGLIKTAKEQEEKRRDEHETMQRRLAEAELAALRAAEQSAAWQRRAIEAATEAEAKEKALEERIRKQALLEQESVQVAREGAARIADLANDEARLNSKKASMNLEAASLQRRTDRLARREHVHDEKVSALMVGIQDIAAGRLNGIADIDRRADLSAAADLIKVIGNTMATKVKQVILDYTQRTEAAASEQLKAAKATDAATEREKAAIQAELKYKAARKATFQELKHLRQIRDLGVTIAKFADQPALRRISKSLNNALDALKTNVSRGFGLGD